MYRYLVTTQDNDPFFTKFFDPESHFLPDKGMVVYDFADGVYTDDGETWKNIEVDHL